MVIDGKLSSRTDNVEEILFSNRILYVPEDWPVINKEQIN